MAFLKNTKISSVNPLKQSLKKIYGIGDKTSEILCKKYGIQKDSRGHDLRNSHILLFQEELEKFKRTLGKELKREKQDQCQRLINIRTYRGIKRKNGLTVRGQRTHTNARTQKKWKRLKLI